MPNKFDEGGKSEPKQFICETQKQNNELSDSEMLFKAQRGSS